MRGMAMTEVDDFGLPVAKRQRLENGAEESEARRPRSSRLFAPYRTLGLVSPTAVPFTSLPLGKTTFQITTSVGRSLQTYDLLRGLNLVFTSRPLTPQTITATCAYRDRVFVAWGGATSKDDRGVWIFKRGRLVGALEVPESTESEICKILVFGTWIVGCGPRAVEVWKAATYEHYTSIQAVKRDVSSAVRTFTGDLCTLPTYLNKVFVGRTDGNVEIYNVSTGKLVYTILPPSAEHGSVSALSSTPALCYIAVAYSNGSIVVHNVEEDEQVMQLRQPGISRAVTSIAFRTDGSGAGLDGRKDGTMATASIESGDITLWDLNDGGRVAGVLRGAHEISSISISTGITGIEFLPNQPVLVSSGLDNAMRSWVFDQSPFSPIPRVLHARSGHAGTISKLKFLPSVSDGSEAAGKWLLSSGQDRSLWGFSLRKDGQSTELSQGNVKSKAKKIGHLVVDEKSSIETLKATPIIDIACSLNRDGGMGAMGGAIWTNGKTSTAEESQMTGWESVVTAHEDDRFARTWFWGKKKAGRWTFESGDHKPVTSVAITTCGTFALVGSAGGSLDMFNLQSGIHRQRFPPRSKPAQAKKTKIKELETQGDGFSQGGHKDDITGIVVDNLNQTILSCSLDGSIIFWDFLTAKLLHRVRLESVAATAMRYNSTSGLVSLACDDLCIRVLDIESRRIVRELWGSVGQIYDHCFSHDGRWIVVCSMDSVIRIFDIATGHLIDAFKTATCTSVAMSNTGEFLATAHAGTPGINIWNNKSIYMHIPTRQIDEDTGVIDLTGSSHFEAISQLSIQDETMYAEDEIEAISGTSEIDQLDGSLLTLSLMPQARWQTLLNLESIRQRNRPIQPPEKPKAAPFFLSSSLINGGKPLEDTSRDQQDQNVALGDRSRVTKLSSLQPSQSPFSTLLTTFSAASIRDPATIIEHLTSLPPSAADLEIRTLGIAEMPAFVNALTAQLRRRKDFELVNTWMSVFLKIHGDYVPEVEDLRMAVLEWRGVMLSEEKRLADLVGYTKGVLDFLRSAR